MHSLDTHMYLSEAAISYTWHPQQVHTVTQRVTLAINRVLKGHLQQFTGKRCPTNSRWQENPAMPQFWVAAVETVGQKQEDPTAIPSRRHKIQCDRTKSHSCGTLEPLCWFLLPRCLPFLVVLASVSLTWHIKLVTLCMAKGNCMSLVTSDQHSTCTICDHISIRLKSIL